MLLFSPYVIYTWFGTGRFNLSKATTARTGTQQVERHASDETFRQQEKL